MDNLRYIIISAILSLLMLKYMFPKLIYWMCEMILLFDQVIELSKGKMKDGKNSLAVRLLFLVLYLICWGMMIVLFVPMQILSFIEIFGGFVKADVIKKIIRNAY